MNIENSRNECSLPWESYFVQYINENDNKVTFKVTCLRNNNVELIFKRKVDASASNKIT